MPRSILPQLKDDQKPQLRFGIGWNFTWQSNSWKRAWCSTSCRRLREGMMVYFFIKSNTALVMDFTPVRSVGSGTGAHKLEWSPGSGTLVR